MIGMQKGKFFVYKTTTSDAIGKIVFRTDEVAKAYDKRDELFRKKCREGLYGFNFFVGDDDANFR